MIRSRAGRTQAGALIRDADVASSCATTRAPRGPGSHQGGRRRSWWERHALGVGRVLLTGGVAIKAGRAQPLSLTLLPGSPRARRECRGHTSVAPSQVFCYGSGMLTRAEWLSEDAGCVSCEDDN